MIKAAFKIIKLEDVPNNGAVVVDIWPNDELVSIIITRRDERVFGYINRCPHAGWPLENFNGQFIFTPENDIICAAHGAIFSATDGRCLGGPGQNKPLQAFALSINGREIIIGDAA